MFRIIVFSVLSSCVDSFSDAVDCSVSLSSAAADQATVVPASGLHLSGARGAPVNTAGRPVQCRVTSPVGGGASRAMHCTSALQSPRQNTPADTQ